MSYKPLSDYKMSNRRQAAAASLLLGAAIFGAVAFGFSVGPSSLDFKLSWLFAGITWLLACVGGTIAFWPKIIEWLFPGGPTPPNIGSGGPYPPAPGSWP